MTQYYDSKKYATAIAKFNHFIETCTVITPKSRAFSNFQISTITCISTIGDKVNIQQFFEELDEKDDDIMYAKYSHFIKGVKKKPSEKCRGKNNNNQLFSNQMSIGFSCENPKHSHKNPISVKVFRNGRIQMTGCKNMEEIDIIYNKLAQKLMRCSITVVDNLAKFHPDRIEIEMINGTFYVNESLNLDQVLQMFLEHYTHETVFIIQNKKSPLNLSIKQFGYFDTKKKKDKIPSVFIYNTGAINIIATKTDILYQTYEFVKENLELWWDQVVEKKIIFCEPCD